MTLCKKRHVAPDMNGVRTNREEQIDPAAPISRITHKTVRSSRRSFKLERRIHLRRQLIDEGFERILCSKVNHPEVEQVCKCVIHQSRRNANNAKLVAQSQSKRLNLLREAIKKVRKNILLRRQVVSSLSRMTNYGTFNLDVVDNVQVSESVPEYVLGRPVMQGDRCSPDLPYRELTFDEVNHVTNKKEKSLIAVTSAIRDCMLSDEFTEYMSSLIQFATDQMAPLEFQNWCLKMHGKKRTEFLLSDDEFAAKLAEEIIYPEAAFSEAAIKKIFISAFASSGIKLTIQAVSTVVTCILSIAALLKARTEYPVLSGIAISANVMNLLVVLWVSVGLVLSNPVEILIKNLLSVFLGSRIPGSECPEVPFTSTSEVRAALETDVQLQADGLDSNEVGDTLLEGYGLIRESVYVKDDNPVMIVVNMISWVVSLGAIAMVHAFGIDIRKAVSHLAFLKYGRELQRNMAKDIGQLATWLQQLYTKPDEIAYNLIKNRITRMEELLTYSPIDIVSSPATLEEWNHILSTTPDFIKSHQPNEGLRNLRNTLQGLYSRHMITKNEHVKELARTRGLRPVPVALHLWSDIGGVGKSSFTTSKLVPEAHKILGSAPGSETWLKLSSENKYFPPIGERSKICVVDEFLTQQAKDLTLCHLNGMISETPYFLDAAFVKQQTFAAELICLLSNIPGCRLSSDTVTFNVAAQAALWGRLDQFEVVNVNRPVNQKNTIRDFEHASDYSDLRFLPGRYIPEHQSLTGNNSKVVEIAPIYSEEVSLRVSRQATTWQPIMINGKWELNYQELLDYLFSKIRERQQNYVTRLHARQQAWRQETKNVENSQVSVVREPFLSKEISKWEALPNDIREVRGTFKLACMFTQALSELYLNFENKMDYDLKIHNYSQFLRNQHSVSLIQKMKDVNDSEDSVFLGVEIFALAMSCEVNVFWNGKYYMDINLEYPVIEIWTRPYYGWKIRKMDKPWRYDHGGLIQTIFTHIEESTGRIPSCNVSVANSVRLPYIEEDRQTQIMGHIQNFSKQQSFSSESVQSLLSDISKLICQYSNKTESTSVSDMTSSKQSECEEQICGSNRGMYVDPVTGIIEEVELQSDTSYEPPVQLHATVKQSPKFTVYIYGKGGGGKTYYASQVANALNLTTGFEVVRLSRVQMDDLNYTQICQYAKMPKIFVLDDCWDHAKYISLWDLVHVNSIFLVTTNLLVENASFVDCMSNLFWYKSWTNYGKELVQCKMHQTRKFSRQFEKHLQQFPSGIVRRSGIVGNFIFDGQFYQYEMKGGLMINMEDKRTTVVDCDDILKLSPEETLRMIWERYNLHLQSIGEVSFKSVDSIEQVQQMLQGQYREPDVEIKARSLEQLKYMLSSSTAILAHYTQNRSSADYIYVNVELLNDKLLSVTNPEMFLLQVNNTMALSDLVTQGVVMYRKLSRTTKNAAVRLIIGNYDIYCYKNVIYVNTDHTQQTIRVVPTEDHVRFECELVVEDCRHMTAENVTYQMIWELLRDQIKESPVEGPLWVLSYIKSHKDEFLMMPPILQLKKMDRDRKQRIDYLKQKSSTWNAVWQEIRSGPYYALLQAAVILAGVATSIAATVGIVKAVSKNTEELKNLSNNVKENLDETNVDLNRLTRVVMNMLQKQDILVSQSKAKIIAQSIQQRLEDDEVPVFVDDEIEEQSYEKKDKSGGKQQRRNVLLNKNFQPRQIFEMVRGMDKIHSTILTQSAQQELIVTKIEDSIVQFRSVETYKGVQSAPVRGYGMVIEGRTIIVPAHYISPNYDRNGASLDIEISTVMKGSNEIKRFKAYVDIMRRDLEIVCLRINDDEKTWQPYSSIRKYFVTFEQIDNIRLGFFLMHQGKSFDRAYCSIDAHVDVERCLDLDRIETMNAIRVTWTTAKMHTSPGCCGLPYICQDQNERMIVGFHIAAGTISTFACLITQEILNDLFGQTTYAIKKIQSEMILDDNTQVAESSNFEYLTDETKEHFPEWSWVLDYSKFVGYYVTIPPLTMTSMEGMASRVKIPNVVRNSKEIRVCGYFRQFDTGKKYRLKKKFSPFSKKIIELGCKNPKFPSITNAEHAPDDLVIDMCYEDGQAVSKSVSWCQVAKACTGFEISKQNLEYLNKATELLGVRWNEVYGNERHRPLNNFEVLNGITHGPYKGHTPGVDLSSAIGLPFSSLFPGMTLKRHYLELIEVNGRLVRVWRSCVEARRLQIHIRAQDHALNAGRVPLFLFKGSLKSELVSKPKSRLFCAGPFDLQYLTTQYFGTIMASIKKNFYRMECQVGVDPISTLSVAWNRMAQMPGSNICVDFKRWDKLLSYSLMKMVGQKIITIIKQNFDYTKLREHCNLENTLQGLLQANIAPCIVVEGTLYYSTRGLPSGSVMTTWLNSLCNAVLSVAVLLRFQEEINFRIFRTSSELHQHIVEINYGDDKVLRVSQTLVNFGFCYSKFKEICDINFGTETTPASKEDSLQELVPIEGSEFISRTPLYWHGPLWKNRLKKSSIEVLWHWLSTSGVDEENAMENLSTIVTESSLWGKKYFDRQVMIANAIVPIAIEYNWHKFIEAIQCMPNYEEVLAITRNTQYSALTSYSMPAVDIYRTIDVCTQLKDRVNDQVIEQSKKQVESVTKQFKKAKIVRFSDEDIVQPITTRADSMLPERYQKTPFKGDFLKTTLWFYLHVLCDLADSIHEPIVAWVSNHSFVNDWIPNATEESLRRIKYFRNRKAQPVSLGVLPSSLILSGDDTTIPEKVSNIFGDLCIHLSKTRYNYEKQVKFARLFDQNRKLEQIIVWIVDEALPSKLLPHMLDETKKTNDETNKEITSLVFKLALDEPEMMRGQTKPMGSTAPTADAQAAPAEPSTIVAQISNQENNGALPFGNPPAQNRMDEGGKLIQITEAAMQNWYSVYKNGGPIINVPVTTDPGTVLWFGSMYDCFNQQMELYANIHDRWYPSVEVLLNFIGTPTWAGNVAVFVTPTAIPAGYDAVQKDNFLRTYAYEQKPLSSNGAQVICLSRLINESQTNVAWDTTTAKSDTGPYIYIQLATSYEQALANPDTAFQIQILSRFGSNVTFGGINIGNVTKMLKALISAQNPSSTTPTLWFSQFSGMSFKDFLLGVVGWNNVLTPQLVINGATYSDQDYSFVDVDTPNHANLSFTQRKEIQARRIILQNVPDNSADIRPVFFNYNIVANDNKPASDFIGIAGKVPGSGEQQGQFKVNIYAAYTFSGWSQQVVAVLKDFIMRNSLDVSLADYGCPDGGLLTWRVRTASIYVRDPRVGVFQDLLNIFIQDGYVVTYRPTAVNIGMKLLSGGGNRIDLPRRHYDNFVVRVEKNGLVDSFMFLVNGSDWVTREGWEGANLEFDFRNAIYPTYEVPVQVLHGHEMGAQWRRFELNIDPVPVNSSTHIPVAMKVENVALQRFFSLNIPPDYLTVVEVQSKVLGKRAFTVIINPDFKTSAIVFGKEQGIPQHAIFNGAKLEDLYINSIRTITKNASLPVSDISQWTSIETTVTDLDSVVPTIQRIKQINQIEQSVDEKFLKQFETALATVKQRELQRKTAKKESKAAMRKQLLTLSLPTNDELQFELLKINSRPRQLRIGAGAAKDRQIAGMIMGIASGGVGAAASAKSAASSSLMKSPKGIGLKNGFSGSSNYVGSMQSSLPGKKWPTTMDKMTGRHKYLYRNDVDTPKSQIPDMSVTSESSLSSSIGQYPTPKAINPAAWHKTATGKFIPPQVEMSRRPKGPPPVGMRQSVSPLKQQNVKEIITSYAPESQFNKTNMFAKENDLVDSGYVPKQPRPLKPRRVSIDQPTISEHDLESQAGSDMNFGCSTSGRGGTSNDDYESLSFKSSSSGIGHEQFSQYSASQPSDGIESVLYGRQGAFNKARDWKGVEQRTIKDWWSNRVANHSKPLDNRKQTFRNYNDVQNLKNTKQVLKKPLKTGGWGIETNAPRTQLNRSNPMYAEARAVEVKEMKNQARLNWLREHGTKFKDTAQLQGAIESAIEYGANKDLANQQHGFDLDSMAEYFKGMSQQQKEALAGDIEKLREQFKGQEGLQDSSQQHEKELQESQQKYSQEEAEKQRAFETQQQETAARNQGILTSGLAGIPVNNPPSTFSSGQSAA